MATLITAPYFDSYAYGYGTGSGQSDASSDPMLGHLRLRTRVQTVSSVASRAFAYASVTGVYQPLVTGWHRVSSSTGPIGSAGYALGLGWVFVSCEIVLSANQRVGNSWVSAYDQRVF